MLIFYYGTETFQPSQKIQTLKDKFLVKNPSGGGFTLYDCAEKCSVSDISQILSAQNLFAEKQLVVIRDFFASTQADAQNELLDFLEVLSTDDVVVFWDQSNPRKNGRLFKWLSKNADTVGEFQPLEGAALSRWIQTQVKDAGGEIVSGAVNELIMFIGNDLQSLRNEIEKLTTYVEGRAHNAAGGRDITSEDVHLLVSGRTEANMFATIEALTAGNKSLALKKLHEQIRSGDDPHQILAMYAYHLRTLLTVGSFYHEQNISDKRAIASGAKLHPFVVEKSLGVIRNIDQKRLVNAHQELTNIDRAIKKGRADIATALDEFVLKF